MGCNVRVLKLKFEVCVLATAIFSILAIIAMGALQNATLKERRIASLIFNSQESASAIHRSLRFVKESTHHPDTITHPSNNATATTAQDQHNAPLTGGPDSGEYGNVSGLKEMRPRKLDSNLHKHKLKRDTSLLFERNVEEEKSKVNDSNSNIFSGVSKSIINSKTFQQDSVEENTISARLSPTTVVDLNTGSSSKVTVTTRYNEEGSLDEQTRTHLPKKRSIAKRRILLKSLTKPTWTSLQETSITTTSTTTSKLKSANATRPVQSIS